MNHPWKMAKLLVIAALVAGVFGVAAPPLTADAAAPTTTPSTVSFQGKIVNFSNGTNVADGNYSITFRLYSASSGGSPVWGETQSTVAVAGGVFQVNLGSTCSFFTTQTCSGFSNTAIDFSTGPSLYLTVQFASDSQETSPRIPLQSVPFAFNAETANKLGGLTASQFVQLSPAGAQTGAINVTGGNTLINNSGTGNTTIGGATGTLTLGGTNTAALTIQNGSSAALSLQSGNAVNITAAAASTLNFGSGNTLGITSSTLTLAASTGVLTLGGTTPTLTATSNSALIVQSQGSGQLTLGTGSTGILGLGTSVTTLQSTLTALAIDQNNASPATLTLKNSNAAGGSVLNLNLLDGALQTNSVTRLDNSGNLASIGTVDAASGKYALNSSGDQTAAFTLLDGSTTTNGTSGLGSSTSLVLTSAANFDVGNYVQVNATNCGGTGINPCYAKITAKATNTLTITPALTWTSGQNVFEYHIPEIGGTDTAQTLANRYGRGYFIGGVATGNGTTYYTEESISTSRPSFDLLNTGVTTLNIGGAATTIAIGTSGTTTSFAGTLSTTGGGNISAGAGALQGGSLSINSGAFAVDSSGAITAGSANTSLLTAGTLGTGRGGTGLNTYTTNGILYSSNSSTIAQLTGSGSAIQFLSSNNGTPSFVTMSGDATLNGTGVLTVATGAITGTKIASSTLTSANFNSGTTYSNITAVGTLTSLALSGAITGATTITASGNINTTAGALQTNSTTRVDASGNLTNIGNFTAAAGSTFTTTGSTGFVFKPGTDNTTAFQVEKADGTPLLMIDSTTNNLITNPGFELGTTNWSPRGTSTLTQNNVKANTYNGLFSLKAAVTAASSGASTNSFTSTISSGTQYTLSVYVESSSIVTALRLGYTTAGGDTSCATTIATSTSGFQRLSCTFTPGANVTAIWIDNNTTGTTSNIFIDAVQLQTGAVATGYQIASTLIRGIITNPLSIQNTANSTSEFQVLNAAGGSALTVDSLNTRLGVGTATPTQALDVVGIVNASTRFSVAGSASLTLTCGGTRYVDTQVISGGISVSSSGCTNPGLSDARVKTDVAPLSSSVLDGFKDLQAVSFSYDCSNEYFAQSSTSCHAGYHAGVIAQQLQPIFPELVQQDEYGVYSVDYQGLAAYTLKAVSQIAQHLDSAGNATLNHVTAPGGIIAPSLVSNGALTLESGNAGSVAVDTGSATAYVNIGAGNAAGVNISRTDQTTTVAGALVIDQAATFHGAINVDNADVTTKGSFITRGGTLQMLDANNNSLFTIDATGNGVLAGNLNLASASVTGGLTVGGDLNVGGLSTFQKLATFIAKTVFRQDVEFDGHITVAADTAGYATLRNGENKVHVTFKNPYEDVPVVNANTVDGQFVQTAVSNITKDGFDISVAQAVTQDTKFSWVALAVKDAQTATNPATPVTP